MRFIHPKPKLLPNFNKPKLQNIIFFNLILRWSKLMPLVLHLMHANEMKNFSLIYSSKRRLGGEDEC
jgi:hypothetical protein